MTSRVRHDAGELARPVKRSDGRVIFSGRACRVGAHNYPWGVERRDESELRRIVDQLPGKPIVINHPRGLLAEGASATVVGQVERAWIDGGGHAAVELRFDDSIAVQKVRSGHDQISLGYALAEARPRGGLHRGTIVDHLAMVPAGRCGPSCSVRLDCSCGCQSCDSTSERRAALAVNILRTRKSR